MGLGGLYHFAWVHLLSGHLLAGRDATLPGVREQALCWGTARMQRFFLLARSRWRLALAWGGRFCVLTLDKCMQKEIDP